MSRYVESIFEQFSLASRLKSSQQVVSTDMNLANAADVLCLSGHCLVSSFRFEGRKPKQMVTNCQFAARAIHLSMFCAPASDTLFASSLPGDHCAECMGIPKYLRIFCRSPKRKSLYSQLYPPILHTSRESHTEPSPITLIKPHRSYIAYIWLNDLTRINKKHQLPGAFLQPLWLWKRFHPSSMRTHSMGFPAMGHL